MNPQKSVKDVGGRRPKAPSGFTEEQEKWISGQITSQLIQLKKQIDTELVADIEGLKEQLLAAITSQISKSEARTEATVANASAELKQTIDTKIATTNNQIVLANKQQLVTVRETTKELIQAVGQQITTAAYKKVIGEINEKIVPKIENMMQYVNYQMQDGGELVTDYRRAVDREANKTGTKMITDGNDKHIISENVSMFFREDD